MMVYAMWMVVMHTCMQVQCAGIQVDTRLLIWVLTTIWHNCNVHISVVLLHHVAVAAGSSNVWATVTRTGLLGSISVISISQITGSNASHSLMPASNTVSIADQTRTMRFGVQVSSCVVWIHLRSLLPLLCKKMQFPTLPTWLSILVHCRL